MLIGTGMHTASSGLPDVPAVGSTLADLEQVLIQRCGMAQSNVRVLADPRSPLEVGLVLAQSARQAQDVLLVCYVGHGVVSPGGELYLATTSTERRPELLAYTALSCTAVRDTLLASPARSIVVVLDCMLFRKSGRCAGRVGRVCADLGRPCGASARTARGEAHRVHRGADQVARPRGPGRTRAAAVELRLPVPESGVARSWLPQAAPPRQWIDRRPGACPKPRSPSIRGRAPEAGLGRTRA